MADRVVSGWRVEVRGRDLASVGPCDVWTSLKATIRHRKAGGWVLVLPASHPQARLFGEGGGIQVWAPWSGTDPWFSGPVLQMQADLPTSSTPAMLTVTGMDDTGMLADRLAMPVPYAPMDSQTDAAYWTASGPAEWVIRHVVDVNAGRSARTERRLCDADPDGRLTFPSLCVGGVRDARARFDRLLDIVDAIATIDNLAVSLVQPAGTRDLHLLVSPTVDRSAHVRLSQPAGTITDGTLSENAPAATHVLVAGSGEETARALALVADEGAAGQWRRIETLRDARDTTEAAELVQRGQEALTDATATGGASVTPADRPGQEFGVHYQLGDIVAVEVGTVHWTEPVTAVEVEVTAAGGQKITPMLGDEAAASASTPAIYNRVRALTRRLDALEARQ